MMTTDRFAPVDNLVRVRYDVGTIGLRASVDGGTGRTLFGHFAVFNQWTRIESWFEGTFLERIAKGAFKRTMKERADQIRVLYEHGRDPTVGNKPLAIPEIMREDAEGAYGQGELFKASYVDDLIPAIAGGQMGQSFRFSVVAESYVEPKKVSDYNPEKLPERTITDVDLYEWGPCPFPAYVGATAGVRSGTDQFLESFMNDPAFVARFTERGGIKIVEKILASLPADGRTQAASKVPADGGSQHAHSIGMSPTLARARLALLG